MDNATLLEELSKLYEQVHSILTDLRSVNAAINDLATEIEDEKENN